MSAWEELQQGQLGQAGIALLYRSVFAVARARNFPPPEGYGSWTSDAVQETAHDFLTGPRGLQRLIDCALRAHDDPSLRRVLERAVLNHLRDVARATARGRLMRRLAEVLSAMSQVAVVPPGVPGAGGYRLIDDAGIPAFGDAVFGGASETLVAAAYAVRDVTLVRWRDDARRDPAPADAQSLGRVSVAVLRAAEGSLRPAELAAVVGQRFALGPAPSVADVDDTEPWGDAVGSEMQHSSGSGGSPGALGPVASPAPDEQVAARASARALIAQLTDRERLVLPVVDESVRDIAQATGLGRSTAATVATRVKQVVGTALADDPDAAQTLAAAVEMLATDDDSAASGSAQRDGG